MSSSQTPPTLSSSAGADFSEESLSSVRRREQTLREFEIRSRAQQLRNVPTLDEEVRMALRFYGEPITLFGEDPGARRDRLKLLMARMDLDGVLVRPPQYTAEFQHLIRDKDAAQRLSVEADERMVDEEEMDEEEEEGEQKELFFTEGPPELKDARLFTAQYSLPRAARRVQQQQMLYALAVHKVEEMVREDTVEQELQKASGGTPSSEYSLARDVDNKERLVGNLKKYSTASTQLSGDGRPLSCIAVSGGVALTTSWSGIVKLWNIESSTALGTYRAHDERATGCCFHPHVDVSPLLDKQRGGEEDGDVVMEDANNGDAATGGLVAFATGGADNVAKLWSLQDTRKPIQVLSGHTNRLSKMAFHPSGRFLGTASFDGTWRLWDIEAGGKCLVEQEGHASEVYAVAFQGDGALCASCDLGGIGRVWDLRTGRTAVVLKGHARKILGIDWHPNGFQLASCSDDNTVRIWDMRQMGSCLYTIPAHKKLVSHVKFEPVYGRYLVTSSYDHTCKIWTTFEYRLVKTLRGHENLVFATDIYKPGADAISNPYTLHVDDLAEKDIIVSCSYDRTWSTYSMDPLALDDL